MTSSAGWTTWTRSAPTAEWKGREHGRGQLLKDDHEKLKKILNDLDSTTERGVKTREERSPSKRELEVHEAIEEEIFYPALKEQPKAKELVLEAYEEHNVVDTIMAEIEDMPSTTSDGARSSR